MVRECWRQRLQLGGRLNHTFPHLIQCRAKINGWGGVNYHYLERGHAVVEKVGGLVEDVPLGIRDEGVVPLRQVAVVPSIILALRAVIL